MLQHLDPSALKLKKKNYLLEKSDLEGTIMIRLFNALCKISRLAYSRSFWTPAPGWEPGSCSALHHRASLLNRQSARACPWRFWVSQPGLGTTGLKALSRIHDIQGASETRLSPAPRHRDGQNEDGNDIRVHWDGPLCYKRLGVPNSCPNPSVYRWHPSGC